MGVFVCLYATVCPVSALIMQRNCVVEMLIVMQLAFRKSKQSQSRVLLAIDFRSSINDNTVLIESKVGLIRLPYQIVECR